MNKQKDKTHYSHFDEPSNFSLVLGGPLYQLLLRTRLTTPTLDLLKRRILVISLFAWLPLFLFSIFEGKAWSGASIPFLFDIENQLRFLVALPLLIAAEYLVHIRIRDLVGNFVDRNIITQKELPSFRSLIDSAMNLRNSVAFEVIILFITFVIGNYLWSIYSIVEKTSLSGGSWYIDADNSGNHLSLAGYWYSYISRPLFQFITVRWYFRLLIWARFLWQTSRLKLNLIPTHPDHACGLGFLALTSSALILLILAHGVMLAALISNSIFFGGEKLTSFIMLIVGFVIFLLVIVLGPLLAFSDKLMQAKRKGLSEYGLLASRYVSEFDFKWMVHREETKEPLIGSSDIQSLADLSNSYQIVREIKPFPFGKDSVLQVIFFTLLPVSPLILTMIPLQELIMKLLKVVF